MWFENKRVNRRSQDISSSGEGSGHTIDIKSLLIFRNDQHQDLTEQWNIKQDPTSSEIETISQKLKMPVKCVEVNSMPKSI